MLTFLELLQARLDLVDLGGVALVGWMIELCHELKAGQLTDTFASEGSTYCMCLLDELYGPKSGVVHEARHDNCRNKANMKEP